MRCTTPTAASQLKHLQVSLLDAFHAAKSNEIKRIKIQIDHTNQETIESKRHSTQEVKKGAPNYKPLKPDTIANIQNCKSSVKSEKLSHSLDHASG